MWKQGSKRQGVRDVDGEKEMRGRDRQAGDMGIGKETSKGQSDEEAEKESETGKDENTGLRKR